MIYKWRPGSRVKGSAQTVGETLESIRNDNGGVLTPGAVVEAARPKKSPLHDQFEWNDADAAEQWRLAQARNLLRAVVTVTGDKESPTITSAFVHLRDSDVSEQAYYSIHEAMGDPAKREQILREALRELQAFRKKYDGLEVLAGLFEQMDRITA